MASPLLEDEGLLREWSPLTDLMQQIPPKAQRGIFTQDLFLTCVDIIPEFIAVGTNLGLVYWYNRTKGDLQRLRCENTASAVTCVKVVSTVDYMVAAGSENGIVTVFQVPKVYPDCIPESLKPKKEKQVERYTISALHTGPVTAIEWSVNGMKLFSGDKNGLVVLTEIDFYMHLSKSVELFNEKYEIVQLSYCQQHLLVSTTYRSVVCHKEDRWVVTQVGQKERKTLGRFGTVFCQISDRPQNLTIYSTRPGLRLWLAEKCGTVKQTLTFKDALAVPYPEAQLINPARGYLKKSRGEDQFGPLLIFRENLLVTYSSEVVYVLNPETISVVAAVCDLRAVRGVAVNKNEIFILEGERSLIRIAYLPEDALVQDLKPEPSLKDTMNLFSSTSNASLTESTIGSSILDLTSKIKENAVAPIIPFQNIFNNGFPDFSGFGKDWNPIVTADEAQELPPLVNIPAENFVALKTEEYSKSGRETFNQAQRAAIDAIQEANYSRGEFLDKIGQQDYESILFKPKTKKKGKVLKKKHVFSGTESGSDSVSTHSARSATSDGEDAATTALLDSSRDGNVCTISPCLPSQETFSMPDALADQRDASQQSTSKRGHKDTYHASRKPDILHNLSSPSSRMMLFDVKPDLRSPASIERDVADKEKILAKVLDLESLCLDHVKTSSKSLESEKMAECEKSSEMFSDVNREVMKSDLGKDDDNDEVCQVQEKQIVPEEPERLDSIESSLSYGPPSGSSAPPSNFASLEISDSALEQSLTEVNEFEAVERADKWIQFKVPDQITNLAVCKSFVCCVDSRDHVYYSRLAGLGLRWQKLDYKASQVSFSMSGDVVWKLVKDIAYALENSSTRGPFGESWHRVTNDVQFVAIGDRTVWLVSLDGRIHVHKVSAKNPFGVALPVPCPWRLSRVSCMGSSVWALTTIGEVIARIGISGSHPEGKDWRRILMPVPIACDIAIGAENTGWIVDPRNVIYYTNDYTETAPVWWQVLISDYIYQQSTPLQQLRSKLTDNYLVSLRSNAMSMMAVGERSIWIAEKLASNVHMNKVEFYGHRWNKVHMKCYLPSVKWQEISAEGIFESKGQLWLLSCAGDLFCSSPNSGNLHALGLPSDCPVACIAASPQSLWLLSTRGRIYIRVGLADSCIDGSSWRELSLDQMTGVHLTHVSCGCDVVWACDQQGVVYMAVGSPLSMASSAFPPVWIPADEKDQRKHIFTKVFVGPQTFMVWALDNKRNVYVREAIFNDFQLGTGWVLVGGIEAVELSVSGSAVWALSPNGSIYRRYGISQNNYIGDYWQKIPGNVSSLSASVSDGVWALDRSVSLLRHDQIAVRLTLDSPAAKPLDTAAACGIDASEWEVL